MKASGWISITHAKESGVASVPVTSAPRWEVPEAPWQAGPIKILSCFFSEKIKAKIPGFVLWFLYIHTWVQNTCTCTRTPNTHKERVLVKALYSK